MPKSYRMTRRLAGLMKKRLPDMGLDKVPDPRSRRGRRWKCLSVFLRATIVGLLSGCKSLLDLEALTDEMSLPMRNMLKIPRRIPDSTLRKTLVNLDPDALRARIHSQIKAAHRRKALFPVGLPLGQLAIDGRSTKLPDFVKEGRKAKLDSKWAGDFDKLHKHQSGLRYRLLRTMTCSLVTATAKPCLDAMPIPAHTNEMGHFVHVLREVVQTYERLNLFKLVSADAGNCSEANARFVRELGLHYLFRLKADQPTLLYEAKRLLGHLKAQEADAETVDVVGNTTVTRRIFVCTEMAGFLDWDHLCTVIRIHKQTHGIETGALKEEENHYAISSADCELLTPRQFMNAFRLHWGVENACHFTWDTAFAEDAHPWIEADPKGMMCVLLLRRMAYNLLALFRAVTQRSDEKRQMPWKTLMRKMYNALISAQNNHLEGLRDPKAASEAVA